MPAVALPCIGDGPYITAAVAQSTLINLEAWLQLRIQRKLLEWQTDQRTQIADLRQMLADRRMIMAEEVLSHAGRGWAAERSFVRATMGEGRATPQYSIANPAAQAVTDAQINAIVTLDRMLGRHGIEQSSCEDQRLDNGMALIRTDLMAHQFRAAEARSVALQDRRFSRQLAALGLGRDILQQSVTMGNLGAGRDIVRRTIIGTVNSAMELWGYASKRWGPSGGWGGGTAAPPQVVPAGHKLYRMPGVNGSSFDQVLPTEVGDPMTNVQNPSGAPPSSWDASSVQG